jgi:hypothetical protein
VAGSVPVLHPEAQTVDEMLEGWRTQQLCGDLDHGTIAEALLDMSPRSNGATTDQQRTVIDDLGLVPELDQASQPSRGDRAGIAVVQADPPGRPVGGMSRDAQPGLRHDLARRGEQFGQVVDRAHQPATTPARCHVVLAADAQFGGLGRGPARRVSAVSRRSPCARLPAARDRSRSRVRTAPPAARIRSPVAAIRRTALPSRPESVG